MTIAAGARLLASDHRISASSYTPLLLASTTNPNLGSTGQAVGSYRLYPDGRVWGRIFIRFSGSGINPGSGSYRVTLPTAAQGAISAGSTGQADIWGWFTMRDDSNVGASRLGYLTAQSVNAGPGGVAVASLSTLDGTGALVNNSYPWVWADGDAIACHFDYMRPV